MKLLWCIFWITLKCSTPFSLSAVVIFLLTFLRDCHSTFSTFSSHIHVASPSTSGPLFPTKSWAYLTLRWVATVSPRRTVWRSIAIQCWFQTLTPTLCKSCEGRSALHPVRLSTVALLQPTLKCAANSSLATKSISAHCHHLTSGRANPKRSQLADALCPKWTIRF